MNVLQIDPHFPEISELDLNQITVSYDECMDTLFLYLKDGDIAPVSVLLSADDEVYALVDPLTEEVVGFQVEAFMSRFIFQSLVMLPAAVIAGVPTERLRPVVEHFQQVESRPLSQKFGNIWTTTALDLIYASASESGSAALV